MNTEEYIDSLLKQFPVYSLSEEEKRVIQKSGINYFINSKVFSNKFRKSAPTESFRNDIEKRIKLTLENNKPIRFTIPTGGYKKWQLKTAPEVDWSEFFHIRFMLEYFSPLLTVYKPGVILDYYSNSWLIKAISYYPQDDIDTYTNSFKLLIEYFSVFFPSNLKIRYKIVTDQVPEKQLIERILKNRPLVESEINSLNEIEQKELFKYSERNIRWDILEKNGALFQDDKNKIIREGKIIHDCLLKGGWNSDLDYLKTDNAIPIIHRNSDPFFLHLASCAGSFVQFWVGTGILKQEKDKYIPQILSYNQYQSVQKNLKKIPLSTIKLKNFSHIELNRT